MLRNKERRPATILAMAACCLLTGLALPARAQYNPVPGAPVTLQNAPQRDTSSRTNTAGWESQDARLTMQKTGSDQVLTPDTSLHTFHRRPFSQPWLRDLGNLGSPVQNRLYNPEYRTGPSLGYHVFNPYRFHTDSLFYYQTNRPFSAFTYHMGSKLEQLARILHTQNINPGWNVAVGYQKITSPGFYKIQRTNHDNGFLSTRYQSPNQRYELKAGIVYNKQQQDENGGIVSDSFLTNSSYANRQTIPVRFQNDAYSVRRSAISNTQRDISLRLQHAWTWGPTDTTYSADSSRYAIVLRPRLKATHTLKLHSEQRLYKDLRPDSLRYIPFFEYSFNPSARDSVYSRQNWFYLDNQLQLSGFLGRRENPLLISAGIGTRTDRFLTDYLSGTDRNQIWSNYLSGSVQKEIRDTGQWQYEASVLLYLTGEAAGNLLLQGTVGKDFGRNGFVTAGLRQEINNAPYSYTLYQVNVAPPQRFDFGKETISQVFARLSSPRLGLEAGVRNNLITNLIYINENLKPSQYAPAFNVLQLWGRKAFTLGRWILDNEVVLQQRSGSGPVNIPAIMGRHQLSYESFMFGRSLKIATGLEARYHSPFHADGYSPLLNRFFNQNTYEVRNKPEFTAFFNFKVKRLRAFLMADQLQQLLWRNTITAPGYPAQDLMFRFGFNWYLIN